MIIKTNISTDTFDTTTGGGAIVAVVAAAEAGCAGEDIMASGHEFDS